MSAWPQGPASATIQLMDSLPTGEVLRVARLHGATAVRVFGSWARGEQTAHSDLDLLVDLEPGRSLLDLVAIKQDLEDSLHRSVDVVTERSLAPLLRERVIAEAISLAAGADTTRARISSTSAARCRCCTPS